MLRTLKDSFARIRYISKEVCRILHLRTQMQCLSGKVISHRMIQKGSSNCFYLSEDNLIYFAKHIDKLQKL